MDTGKTKRTGISEPVRDPVPQKKQVPVKTVVPSEPVPVRK